VKYREGYSTVFLEMLREKEKLTLYYEEKLKA